MYRLINKFNKKILIFLLSFCGWTNFFVKNNANKTKKDENIEKKEKKASKVEKQQLALEMTQDDLILLSVVVP